MRGRLLAVTCILVAFAALPAYSAQVTSSRGVTATVAASAAPALQCVVNALEAEGYPVRFMGGYRRHGSVRGSLHPLGLALDVNQFARGVTRPHMPANEISLAARCGAISGAVWRNNDSGHFQVGGWGGYSGRRHHHHHRKHVRHHRRH